MADNVGVKDASGATVSIGADELTDSGGIGGPVQVPFTKIMDGVLGSGVKAGVTTNGLKVEATMLDGANAALGTTTNAEVASGNGSVIAILKRVRTLLGAGLPGALGLNGGVKMDQVSAIAISRLSDTIAAALATDAIMTGTLEGANLTALPYKFAPVSASASGNTQLVAGVTGKKIRPVCGFFTANLAVNFKFRSATAGDQTGLAYTADKSGFVLPFAPCGWFETAVGEALQINLITAQAVGGAITYVEAV